MNKKPGLASQLRTVAARVMEFWRSRANYARAIGVLITVIFFAGCGREADNSGQAGAGQEAPAPAVGVPRPPAEVRPQSLQVQPGDDPATVLEELNRELRRWLVRNQRKPASFEEFVTSAKIQVPPPPPGKKYVITRQMRVDLVKQ